MNNNTEIRTLVTHINQKKENGIKHIVFIHGTSVYIKIQNVMSNGDTRKNYAIKNVFRSYEEAKAFQKGYVSSVTLFHMNDHVTYGTYMETVSLVGYTVQR